MINRYDIWVSHTQLMGHLSDVISACGLRLILNNMVIQGQRIFHVRGLQFSYKMHVFIELAPIRGGATHYSHLVLVDSAYLSSRQKSSLLPSALEDPCQNWPDLSTTPFVLQSGPHGLQLDANMCNQYM